MLLKSMMTTEGGGMDTAISDMEIMNSDEKGDVARMEMHSNECRRQGM